MAFTEDQINAAIEAYRRGQLAEAGSHIGVSQNDGEADPDFNARMRAALALPDWVPTPLPLPGMTGTTETTEGAKPAPEPEDNPEPEDTDDEPRRGAPRGRRH